MITPQAFATMAGVVLIWAGAHFFGIGEIADVILLIVGWVALYANNKKYQKQGCHIESDKPWGDAVVGHNSYPGAMSKDEAYIKMLTTLYDEQVHMAIAPKFYLLRELRIFIRQSAYSKSFILRYFEEALAETLGLLRVRGMSAEYIIQGFKFPLGN